MVERLGELSNGHVVLKWNYLRAIFSKTKPGSDLNGTLISGVSWEFFEHKKNAMCIKQLRI